MFLSVQPSMNIIILGVERLCLLQDPVDVAEASKVNLFLMTESQVAREVSSRTNSQQNDLSKHLFSNRLRILPNSVSSQPRLRLCCSVVASPALPQTSAQVEDRPSHPHLSRPENQTMNLFSLTSELYIMLALLRNCSNLAWLSLTQLQEEEAA